MTPIPIAIDKKQNTIIVSPKTLEFEFMNGSNFIYFTPEMPKIVLAKNIDDAIEKIDASERCGMFR